MTKQVDFLLPETAPEAVESFVIEARKAYIRKAVMLGVDHKQVLPAWTKNEDQIAAWVFETMTTGKFYEDPKCAAISIGRKLARLVANAKAVA